MKALTPKQEKNRKQAQEMRTQYGKQELKYNNTIIQHFHPDRLRQLLQKLRKRENGLPTYERVLLSILEEEQRSRDSGKIVKIPTGEVFMR